MQNKQNKQNKKTKVIDIYSKGDEFQFKDKQVKVVEILEEGRLHVKNLNEPFDSFIALESEIQKETE